MSEQAGKKLEINAELERLVSVLNCRCLPGNPSKSTIYRARAIGFRSRKTKEMVRLEVIQICGKLYTSFEAYERFLNRLNGIDLAPA